MYEFDTTEEQAESATRAAGEFRDYVLGLIEERRYSPRDDMVTYLTQVELDGRLLTHHEILDICYLFLLGGLDSPDEGTVSVVGTDWATLSGSDRARRPVA